MNILITGATGLIGRQLLLKLLEHKSLESKSIEHNITLLCRDITKAQKQLGPNYSYVDNIDAVDFNTIDGVINLAGEPIADKRWSTKQKNEICHSRWNITEKISEKIAAAETPPSVFISGSAIGIYGRQNQQPITEDFTQFHPEFTHHVCQQWESLALLAQSANTRVCLLRTGVVLADNGGALKKMLPAFKLGLGGPIADGQQMMSWVHIDDMVNIILFCLTHNTIQGAINATAPQALSNKAFAKALAHRLNRPCLFTVPKFVLSLLLGEMSDLLIYGQNVVPEKLHSQGFTFKYNTLPEALNSLTL